MKRRIGRMVLLGSVLFLTGFTVTSGEEVLPKPPEEGFVMIPKSQMNGLMKEVQEILRQNYQLGQALESAQNTIRNGMGCT